MKNIVYIFCDELRQDALGCYGNPVGSMKTPNIDSIAANGALFENCFCNSPICVPSRASLLTGLYPEDTAVYDNEAALPSFRLPRPVTTFPQVLAQAGYRTANFGKTHVPPEMAPFQLDVQDGSEMTLGLSRKEVQSLPRIKPRKGINMNVASLYPEDRDYYPEVITRNAISWIQEQTEPFFVRISYTQPHSPIILKRGYEALYQDYPFEDQLPDISQLSQFEQALASAVCLDTLTPQELRTAKAYYYGLVCWVDDQVGQILECLRQQNLMDDTIIVVNADHGALRGECRGLGKHVFNRASQAVPLIIADPEDPQKGRRVPEVVSNIDIARTLLELVKVPVPQQFKGENIMAGQYPGEVYGTIGYGEPDSCAFPNRQLGRLPGDRGWPRRCCIRTQRYRLDLSTRIDAAYTTAENDDLFFVDTQVCPREDRNMARLPEYAEIVKQLRTKLLAHAASATEVPPEMVRMPEGGISVGQ